VVQNVGLVKSSRETHPPVEGGGTLLAPAAGLFKPYGVGYLLDNVAEADLLFCDKPRKPHAIQWAFMGIGFGCVLLIHAIIS
jgi:hypothetical protein